MDNLLWLDLCPFTGEEPTYQEWLEHSRVGSVDEEGFFVSDYYEYCRISTSMFSIEGPKDWAVNFWNTRHHKPSPITKSVRSDND